MLGPGAFRATELTRGPWNPEHQHAGPPIALVARAIEQRAAELELPHVARLTANLLRPIPIGELTVEVQTEYTGRNVAHLGAQLSSGGKQVARCTAVAHREADVEISPVPPGHPLPKAPRSFEESEAARFPFSRKMRGYQDFVEARVAQGVFFRGPCAIWMRMRYPLLAGEAPSGLQRVVVAADSTNGVSSVLDFHRYLFVNSDLTINLLRRPRGEWICIDAQTHVGPSGSGLAESRLFDIEGLIGRATQSLPVRLRD